MEAVSERDYPVLQGAFLLIAVAVVIANLVADVVYGWLDPRVSRGMTDDRRRRGHRTQPAAPSPPARRLATLSCADRWA